MNIYVNASFTSAHVLWLLFENRSNTDQSRIYSIMPSSLT